MTSVELEGAEFLSPESNEAPSVSEHTLRVQKTLGIINAVSELVVEKDIELVSVQTASDISHEPGVYVLDGHNLESKPLADVKFRLEPVLLSGVADSAHTVIAGQLMLACEDGTRSNIQVATKCYAKRTFNDRFARAAKEVLFMQELGRLDELTTEPIAVIVAPDSNPPDGEVLVLTAYNPQLLTMDNYPWGRGLTGLNRTRALQAVKALARFNTLGIKHGDAKIKNIAEEEGRGVGMIDYETCSKIDPMSPTDAGMAAYDDFGLLIKSLVHKGFLQDDYVSKVMLQDMAEEYIGRWDGYPNVQDGVYNSIVAAVENLELPHKKYAPIVDLI